MVKTEVNGWRWQVRDPSILDGWFMDFRAHMKSGMVKRNPQRTVFKVDDRYFVKYFTPHKLDDKIRELVFSRAVSEFRTGLEIAVAGLPVVEYLGCGRRGIHSLLVTQALNDAPDLQEYWYRTEQRDELLHELAFLTRQIIMNNWFHPDYHAGNLLYKQNLYLVDAYGIANIEKYGAEQKYRMANIILGLKENITDTQAASFLCESRIAANSREGAQLWDEYLGRDGVRITKDWDKRRGQIVSNYRKFVEVRGNQVLRKLQGGGLSDLAGSECREYEPDKAMELWLRSFQLELQGLPCRKPLALEDGCKLYWPVGTGSADNGKTVISRAERMRVDLAESDFREVDGKVVIWLE